MEYIIENRSSISLEVEAIKKELKFYCIVHRRKIISNKYIEDNYDLYKMEKEEFDSSLSVSSLELFAKNYLTKPLSLNEEYIRISFYEEMNLAHEIGKPIKVVIFEPNSPGYTKIIQNTRKVIEDIVAGDTEYVYLGREDMVLICNEVGMLRNLPKHRGLHGTFLIKGLDRFQNEVSLTDKQIKEVLTEFDKKENFESKSKYLKEYFQTHDIPRKVFTYTNKDTVHYIGTESIIEFLLSHEDKETLQMIELEIRDIERNKKDIYIYLKQIGYQLAKKTNR